MTTTPDNPYLKDWSITGQDKVWYARAKFGEEEIAAVVRCLSEFQLSPGKYTYDFEARIAALFAKDHGVMVNSGSAALLLLAEALDLRPGDDVITAASGFPTTINPFLARPGVTVQLVDVDPLTLSPDLDQLEAAISDRTRVVVLAHIWGSTLDMPAIRAIVDRHPHVTFVEDSCDSLVGTIGGVVTGHWSDVSVTSFYPSHVITAGGGGGMVCVNDEALARKIRALRDWGRDGSDSEDLDTRFAAEISGIPYDEKFVYGLRGFNLKATEMQAAFGLAQLAHLDEWNGRRRENQQALAEIVTGIFGCDWEPIHPAPPDASPSWLAFPFLVHSAAERRELAMHLERQGIQTRPILAGNFLRHKAYRDVIETGYLVAPFRNGLTPGADRVAACGLGVGLHPEIGAGQLARIEAGLATFWTRAAA